ncbi:unnamed protein product [Sphagnum balticum]
MLDARRRELIETVRRTRDDKRKVLQEQLGIIQAEKAKVEQICSGLQHQVSRIYAVIHRYYPNFTDGSAPHHATHSSGTHYLDVRIFNRPIKASPLEITVTAHHPPLNQFASVGSADWQLCQPTRVLAAANDDDRVYVLDTGNCRVAADQLTTTTTLMTLNWRARSVAEHCPLTGRQLRTFSFSEFVEPIDLCVDTRGRILVADNGARKVFVFDHCARPSVQLYAGCAWWCSNIDQVTVTTTEVEWIWNHFEYINIVQTTTKQHRTASGHMRISVHHVRRCRPQRRHPRRRRLKHSTLRQLRQFVRIIQVIDDSGSCPAAAAMPIKSPPTPQVVHKALVGGIVVDTAGAMILSTVTEKQRTYVSVSSYKVN